MQVEYADHQVLEVLVVRAVGPDGIAETEDDIVTSRRVILPKELAGAAIKEVSRIALESLKRDD